MYIDIYFANVKNMYGYENLFDFIFIDIFGEYINELELLNLFNYNHKVNLHRTITYIEIKKIYKNMVNPNDIILFILLLIKINKIQKYNGESFVDLYNKYMIVKYNNKPTIMKYKSSLNKDNIIGFIKPKGI